MNRLRHFIVALTVGTAFSALAQNPPVPTAFAQPTTVTNLIPPTPKPQSPVTFFRELLAMTPAERSNALAIRPAEVRTRILVKVHEYQLLGPDECEFRLRATELRWWLTPLLRTPAAEREGRLAMIPDDMRELVKSRLSQWDILPPQLQQEFLANDHALHYFARVETTNAVTTTPEQLKISEQCNQFFELTALEKKSTLNSLSDAERAQMEKTLQTFEQLPSQQRMQCLRNYAKFAGMPLTERTEFLKNAANWSKLSPKERQTWRDLVTHVPQWPPMPPAIIPPNLYPHAPPKIPRPSMATNLN